MEQLAFNKFSVICATDELTSIGDKPSRIISSEQVASCKARHPLDTTKLFLALLIIGERPKELSRLSI